MYEDITHVNSGGARLEHATVKAATEAGLIVHSVAGVATAQVAVGCLVEPEAGDQVLVSHGGGQCFVLTVLARSSASRAINVSGDLSVTADNVRIAARQDTAIVGASSAHVAARRFSVTSDETAVRSKHLDVSGEEGHAHFARVRLLATGIETIADRVVQSARQVVRKVEETEATTVRNLIQTVRDNYLSRSKRTSITARNDVQVDAERIHMG